MRMRLLLAVALALAPAVGSGLPSRAAQAPRPRVVVEGLEFPAGIAFHPDGRMLVTERTGRLRVVRGGRLQPRPLAEIATTTSGETGLLGVTLSPDASHVYVFATDPSGQTNRVLRVPVAGGRPEIVVEGLPASVYHNGGGLAFDRDGMLLVSNGERHESERAQDPDELGGKVYRFTPEGGIPPDNPFGQSPAFAIGLRNPFGLALDPVSGRAFVTENGPESFDEVDRIEPGGNYGWPVVSGPAGGEPAPGPGTYHDPLLAYEEVVVPTGIAFAHPATAQARYRGDLFFGTYGEGAVHRVRLDGSRRRALSDDVFVDPDEPVIALAWGPRGLYYSTPRSVELVPIARKRPASRARSGAGSPSPASPQGSGGRTAPEEETSEATPWAVVGIVGLAVVAALAYWVSRTRSPS